MRVIAAVDVYQQADQTVDMAVAWAMRLGARLDLLYVDEFPFSQDHLPDATTRSDADAVWQTTARRIDGELARLLERIPAEFRGEAHKGAGKASVVIGTMSAGYDALLIRTHGRSGLAHLLLGSVAGAVVREAKVPVLVLHPRPAQTA
mgnify:CR=1 FL=1